MIKVFEGISKEQIADVIDEIAGLLTPGSFVFLEGDPGSGKTYLISQLLWRFDISEVASPTFALHHQYQSSDYLFHHFDLYRVESEDELETVGLWDLINDDPHAVFLVEWGSKFPPDIWPMDALKIKIEIIDLGLETRDYKLTFDRT